jgi:hypothetical protein
MKPSLRITLLGAFAAALLSLSPIAASPAHALVPVSEIVLNSSNVQVVHNSIPNTDVLNASLDVTSNGDAGSCDGGDDDLLGSGVFFAVSSQPCGVGGVVLFSFITYVEHTIGGVASYGTHFFSNGTSTLASKIARLATPIGACGRWTINIQVTGVDLSAFTSSQIALLLNDSEGDASGADSVCFNVNANIGNGITKPHHGVHHARH